MSCCLERKCSCSYAHTIRLLFYVITVRMRSLATLLAFASLLSCCHSFRSVSMHSTRTRRGFARMVLPRPPASNKSPNYNEGVTVTTIERSMLYQLLSTTREELPGQCNFFYNDEVMSHLHGYMLLVGLFIASDPTFVLVFGVLATISAGATELGLLPANPRVPALVAVLTLIMTCLCRYGISYEPLAGIWNDYERPTESALYFEMLVCFLNVTWGFGGSWRTKEPIDGATFGF